MSGEKTTSSFEEYPNFEGAEHEDNEISTLSKRGYQLLKEGLIEESKAEFKKILAIEHNNYALVGLGDCERKQGNFQEAIAYYKECISYHPGNNYALFGLADCYKALNQLHKAIEIWEQYLTHDDRNITVLTRVADAYRKIRDFKKSKQIYLRALEMEENNPYALIGLGHLHYDFKEYNDALFYWTRMLDQNENSADIRVLTSIGNCHRKLKTFDKGLQYFERALKYDPKNFYALYGLADCYRGMNQQHRSIEYWNKILEIYPENKVILTRAGDAYRNSGNYTLAEEYYKKAMSIEFDIYAALGLALLRKGQGRYEESAEQLEALIKDDPKNHRLYIALAENYEKMGKKQKAIEVLETFQRHGIRSHAVTSFLERLKNS